MAVLFADGFETYGLGNVRSALDDVYNWVFLAAGAAIPLDGVTVVAGRNGGQAIEYEGTSNALDDPILIPVGGLSTEDTWIVGVAVRAPDGWQSGTHARIWFRDYDGEEMLSLCITSAGDTEIRLGDKDATLIDSHATGLTADAWSYLELKVTFHGSTGSYEARVATGGPGTETTIMSDTGVNTTATGVLRPWEIALGDITNNDVVRYDDLVVLDDSGSINNDFLGDISIFRVRPNGVGDSSDFTTSAVADNYTLVAEDDQDEDSSYVESKTVGNIDLYHYEGISVPTGKVIDAIPGVVARPVLRKVGAGTRTYRLLAKSGSATDVTSALANDQTYVRHSITWETDPNTSAAWTEAGFDAAQFGVEIVS